MTPSTPCAASVAAATALRPSWLVIGSSDLNTTWAASPAAAGMVVLLVNLPPKAALAPMIATMIAAQMPIARHGWAAHAPTRRARAPLWLGVLLDIGAPWSRFTP